MMKKTYPAPAMASAQDVQVPTGRVRARMPIGTRRATNTRIEVTNRLTAGTSSGRSREFDHMLPGPTLGRSRRTGTVYHDGRTGGTSLPYVPPPSGRAPPIRLTPPLLLR